VPSNNIAERRGGRGDSGNPRGGPDGIVGELMPRRFRAVWYVMDIYMLKRALRMLQTKNADENCC
jgi:hypothetical protein